MPWRPSTSRRPARLGWLRPKQPVPYGFLCSRVLVCWFAMLVMELGLSPRTLNHRAACGPAHTRTLECSGPHRSQSGGSCHFVPLQGLAHPHHLLPSTSEGGPSSVPLKTCHDSEVGRSGVDRSQATVSLQNGLCVSEREPWHCSGLQRSFRTLRGAVRPMWCLCRHCGCWGGCSTRAAMSSLCHC